MNIHQAKPFYTEICWLVYFAIGSLANLVGVACVMTFSGGGRMGRFLGATESAACVTEQKLDLNSGRVAGAAGKGRFVGVPTRSTRKGKSVFGFECISFIYQTAHQLYTSCITEYESEHF
jgi:hypothetical protein